MSLRLVLQSGLMNAAYFSNMCVVFVVVVACPAGYEQGLDRCYRLLSSKLNWPDALAQCERDGASLAVPTNAAQNKWLFDRSRSIARNGE